MRRPPAVLSAVATVALAAATLSVTSPAGASGSVGYPSGEHLSTATSSSITVSLNHSANATAYRMYVSTVKSNLYVANISHTSYVSSSSPVLTRRSLSYTSAPMYYRVYAYSSTSHSWGAVQVTGLQPPVPTGVAAHTTAAGGGVSITWNDSNAAGFAVTQATNSAMTANRVTRYIYGRNLQFTPYGLSGGVRYWFQVRGRNYGPLSGMSNEVSAVAPARVKDVRVMTYNILEGNLAGTREGDGPLASWAARKAGVVKLIRQGQPGLVAIQEAAYWVGSPQGYGGHRQIDDLVRSMPEYGLARTETPPTEHYYYRTGNYILYRKADFAPVGTGGHWDLGNSVTAAYQVMQNKTTGAKMLFTSTHLTTPNGSSYDSMRQSETSSFISKGNAAAAAAHVPVIFAGDYNSHSGHALDGPAVVMRGAHVTDTRQAAIWRYNDWFNSANQNYRTALKYGYSIDHVYAGAGVGVRSWGVIVDLSNGKFVGTIPSDHNPVWATLQVSY